jgi:WD40 repeat protein
MKKIDLDLLNSIGKPRAIIDGMLDRQVQALEAKLGRKAGGAGNKLLSLFVKNGFRVQLSESEIVEKMQKLSNLSKNQIDSLLDGLKDSGLLRQTPEEQYELANNFIARKAHEKVEAENRVLRTIKSTIQDRMSRNELLDRTYLNYITPSLHLLDLNPEESKFVKNSEAAVRRRRRWLNTALTILFLLMATFAVGAIYNSRAAVRSFNESQANLEKLRLEQAKTKEAQKKERIARIEADSARENALRERQIAINARDTADQLRLKAIADRDSINALKGKAESLIAELQVLRKQAETKAEEEVELRKVAEKNKTEADLLRLKAEQLNKIITSRIAANRSLQIEDTHMRALIALEAYRINNSNKEVGDIYHPNIVRAMYSAVEAREEGFFNHKEIVGSVRDIVVAPSGDAFYTTGGDGKVRAWAIGEWNKLGKPELSVQQLNAREGSVNNALAINSSGRLLLVGGESGDFQIIDTYTGNLLSTYSLPHQGEEIFSCEFDEEGNFCGLGRNHAYFLFRETPGDVTQDQFRYKRQDNNRNPLISIDKVPSKVGLIRKAGEEIIAYAATGEYNNLAYAYSIIAQKLDGDKNIQEEYNFFGGKNEVDYGKLSALAFKQYDEKNGLLVYGFSSGRIMILRLDELDVIDDPFFASGNKLFIPHQAPISTMAFSENGKFLAVASYDGSVSVWDMSRYEDASYQPMVFDDMSSWAMTVAFANNDETLITGCKDGNLYFWNTNPDDYADYLCSHLGDNEEVYIAQQKELNDRQNKSGGFVPRYNELAKKDYITYFGNMADGTQRKVNVCKQ